jgi:hypothetical protein
VELSVRQRTASFDEGDPLWVPRHRRGGEVNSLGLPESGRTESRGTRRAPRCCPSHEMLGNRHVVQLLALRLG